MKPKQIKNNEVKEIRCFIALEIPENLLTEISAKTNALKTAASDIRWTRPENIHLTLKFLGNTPVDKITAIKESINTVSHAHCPIKINLLGAGAFPNLKHPKVIWVVLDDIELIMALQSDIELALKPHGFWPEKKPFRPHLTIGRTRRNFASSKGTFLSEIKALEALEFGSATINEIFLIESMITSTGAKYTTL